jgi:hypothetical protein
METKMAFILIITARKIRFFPIIYPIIPTSMPMMSPLAPTNGMMGRLATITATRLCENWIAMMLEMMEYAARAFPFLGGLAWTDIH